MSRICGVDGCDRTHYSKGLCKKHYQAARYVARRPVVSDEERFWQKVDTQGGEDACWLWTACRERFGYGVLRRGERKVKAHRFAWELANGPIPAGLEVCHRCDVPACVNPAHLFLGTAADNAQDRNRKGRAASKRGTLNGRSRLTERGVGVVREMAGAGLKARGIAEYLGLHETTVRLVLNGTHWQDHG